MVDAQGQPPLICPALIAYQILSRRLQWLPAGVRRVAYRMTGAAMLGTSCALTPGLVDTCSGCGQAHQYMLQCNGCWGRRTSLYCSTACLDEHWQHHKAVCHKGGCSQ